jgi:GR25 family glycosyltransferase involved in LPS biosynthesis
MKIYTETQKNSLKTYVVNLKKREDRREEMKKLFSNINFNNYEFFEAVNGSEIALTLEIKNLFEGNDFGNRKGMIGCALSHYNLWLKLAQDRSNEYYIIVEDDIEISNNFSEELKKAIILLNNNLNTLNNIDFLYLGYSKYDDSENKYYDETGELQIKEINIDNFVGGTFGYIATKKGALKMLKIIEEEGIKYGIDWLMRKKSKYLNGPLNLFTIQPNIIFSEWVRTSDSNIDSDIQKDFSRFNFDEINDFNGYYIFKQMDQIGNDSYREINCNINNLLKISNSNNNIDGFNTLGYIKNKIKLEELKISQWMSNKDLLFVKMDKIIKVKLISNYATSSFLQNEWNNMSKGNFKWNNILIVDDNYDVSFIDYFVIINKPLYENIFYIPKKTIIFQMEPWSNEKAGVKTWGKWAEPDENIFLDVRNHKKYINNCQSQLNITYDELLTKQISKKYNKICCICSANYFDTGHIKRVDFIRFLEELNDNDVIIDVYGRDNYHNFKNYKGPLPNDSKDIMMDYKYYFMAENNKEYNYITEKFWETVLAECFCFYWGADNLKDYICPESFISLELDSIEEFTKSYILIKNSINNNIWDKKINLIKAEKQKVMNYYNFYPTIERIITKDIWTQPNLGENINLDYLIKNTVIIIINHHNIIDNDPKNSPFYLTMKEFGFNILIYDRFGNLNQNNLFIDIINNKNENNSKNYFVIDNENNPYTNLNSSINIFFNHLSYLPENYDVCYLNNKNNEHNINKFKIIEQKTVVYYTIRKYFFSGMKNYIISKKGAEKVINYLKNNIIYSSEELFYNCCENIEDFNFYISKDILF